eukprot:3940226-Rhodomonas_salina.2
MVRQIVQQARRQIVDCGADHADIRAWQERLAISSWSNNTLCQYRTSQSACGGRHLDKARTRHRLLHTLRVWRTGIGARETAQLPGGQPEPELDPELDPEPELDPDPPKPEPELNPDPVLDDAELEPTEDDEVGTGVVVGVVLLDVDAEVVGSGVVVAVVDDVVDAEVVGSGVVVAVVDD